MVAATILVHELGNISEQGHAINLIDVRTPAEFREVHADIVRNIPLDRLDPQELKRALNGDLEKPCYIICRSGNRGKQACQKLAASGFENVINVEGGTQAWDAAGLPVVRGKKTISLERQVRIAAGFLVLLGVALAWFHSAFLAISAFVGGGLIFAGITDTCGMGMMLARMPWNQVASECNNNQCSA
jgi:rhodanese-related sulfurtransferase